MKTPFEQGDAGGFDEVKYKKLLERLEISEILLSELEYSKRLDSEYYRPIFLEYEKAIIAHDGVLLKELSNFLIGPFGSAFHVDRYTTIKSYRYIRGKDVKPLQLMNNDNVYMPKSDFIRLSKYALLENDILVSVVGTLGNAALISQNDLPALYSCKSTVLRPFGINPIFLLVYINTKYGYNLLIRKERGAIQKGLNLDDLKDLLVFNPTINFQLEIEKIYKKAQFIRSDSQQIYRQAETLLLEELGLKDFKPSRDKINVKTFNESFAQSGRLDAEYYQVKYEEIVDIIQKQKHDFLGNLVQIKKSIEPGSAYYDDKGIPFLRVADFNKYGISTPQKYLSFGFIKENTELIEALKPKAKTILFSKDGSVGNALMLERNENVITSGAILHLKVFDENTVLPQYLTLVLNSLVVKMQAERDSGGSIILHWKPSEIEQVLIPIVDFEIQKQISQKVAESFRLKRQSEQLLEMAKTGVEMAIEKSEEVALGRMENELAKLNIVK